MLDDYSPLRDIKAKPTTIGDAFKPRKALQYHQIRGEPLVKVDHFILQKIQNMVPCLPFISKGHMTLKSARQKAEKDKKNGIFIPRLGGT